MTSVFKFITIFLFLSSFAIGQNRHLNIGFKKNGICFGNSRDYNGLRFNLWDKNANRVNGLNLSGLSRVKTSNGLAIGILASIDSLQNGVNIGGLAALADRQNGLAIGGLLVDAENRLNGVGIAFLAVMGDTLAGLFFGFAGVTEFDISENIKLINGVAIGGIGVRADKLNGFALSLIYNSFTVQNGVSVSAINQTDELHGFQFGLLNYAGNNRPLFRWTPFLNFNLRRQASR